MVRDFWTGLGRVSALVGLLGAGLKAVCAWFSRRQTLMGLRRALEEATETQQKQQGENQRLQAQIERLQAELAQCQLEKHKLTEAQAALGDIHAALEQELAARPKPVFCDLPEARHDLSGW